MMRPRVSISVERTSLYATNHADWHIFEFRHDSQVGVPGAFTGTCSAQIPGYINAYDDFKAKGIKNIYVVSINDIHVMK